MPSREDIAEWMREAGRVEVALARMSGAGKGAEDFSAPWEQRAAQVEAIRCVECKKSKGPSVNAVTFCNKFFVNVPHDHGCFAHEQKDQR